MFGRRWVVGGLAVLIVGLAAGAEGWAQAAQPQPDQKSDKKQDIPDAPSAVKPPSTFPTVPQTTESEGPPPPSSSATVPSGTAPGPAAPLRPSGNDELFRIVTKVNQVLIPVRVTDDSGRLSDGLLDKDFVVYEDGKKQTLN